MRWWTRRGRCAASLALAATVSACSFRPFGTAAGPPTSEPSATTGTTAPATSAAPRWNDEMLAMVNEVRAERGVGPLVRCEALDRAAQDYALVLEDWGNLSHTGPDGSDIGDRAQAVGYGRWNYLGENIAFGQPDVSAVMAAWMRSPGHRENILLPSFTHIGVGTSAEAASSSRYWVQVFGADGTC